MNFKGKVWKFGDDVDTDMIIPARYLNVSDSEELARNCFVDVRPEFADGVSRGDIIIGGRNFGCGSSREHAPMAIKAAGVDVIIAKSFARIFYRNAFNIGLPLIESEDAGDAFADGEIITVDVATGELSACDGAKRSQAQAIPDFMRELVQAGGLVGYIREKKLHK